MFFKKKAPLASSPSNVIPSNLADDPIVIAHIGAHKTATSLIQQQFKWKKEYYAKKGIHVVTRDDVGRHIGWGGKLVDNPGNLNAFLKEGFSTSKQKTFAFSYEDTLGRPFGKEPGLYPDHKKIVPYLREALDGFNSRIAVVIRPQWDFLESYYLQRVHEGYFLTFNQFLRDIDLDQIWWEPLVENLRYNFGRKNVVIMNFDSIKKGQRAFLAEFLQKTIDSSLEPAPFDEKKVHNPSLSDRGLQIALRINPLLEPGTAEVGEVRRFLQKQFSNRTEPRPNLLSESMKADLRKIYEGEISNLARGAQGQDA